MAKNWQSLDDLETDVLEREQVKEPNHYTIVLHNDDFTTQEFVTHILMHFLYQSEENAMAIMLKVHKEGKAPVGRFIKDIAETKALLITSYSRENGMPLLVTVEKL